MSEAFDVETVAALVRRTTKASGVPERLEDPVAARAVAAVLKGEAPSLTLAPPPPFRPRLHPVR